MTVDTSEMHRVGTLAWYLSVAKRNRRVILLAGAMGALLGLANMLRQRQYVATARFRAVASANNQQSALSAIGAQFGIGSIGTMADAPELYINILRSRDLLRELGSKQYSLTQPERFTGDLYTYFKIKEGKSPEGNLKLVKTLQDRIKTSVDRITGIITFEVSTGNPQLSETVSDTALELLNQYDITRRRNQARAEREFVAQRLADERAALNADENALTSFYKANRQLLRGAPGGSPELSAEEARLQRRVQFTQQVYLALAQNLARAELEESRNTPVIALLERPAGFVERRPRGTLRLMIVLGVLGVALGSVAALVREYRAMLATEAA